MLEIIGMVAFFRKLKGMLIQKGRGQGLAFLGPVFWILGELTGAFFCALIFALIGIEDSPLVYLAALVGALIGAMCSYVIVRCISAIPLICPACCVELPSDLVRTFSKHTCEACDSDLKIFRGEVSEFEK